MYPGQDVQVRVAKLQVGRTTLVTPVSKLCLLKSYVLDSMPTKYVEAFLDCAELNVKLMRLFHYTISKTI